MYVCGPDGLQLRPHRQHAAERGFRRARAPAAPLVPARLRAQHHGRRRPDQRRRPGRRHRNRRAHGPLHRSVPCRHDRARRGPAGRRAARHGAHPADHPLHRAAHRGRPRLRGRRPRAVLGARAIAEYGHLSGRDPDELLAGARVEVAPYKKDPGDFVLWKPSPPAIVGWPSPWGRGRPGWHIECSTMVEEHLGETIDIHAGGVDLVFPHHENETAQSTCAHAGKVYARHWLHNGLVPWTARRCRSPSATCCWCAICWLATRPRRCAWACSRRTIGSRSTGRRSWAMSRSKSSIGSTARCATRASRARRAASRKARAPAAVLAALEDDLNTPVAIAELFTLARAANRAADPNERRALAESLRAGGALLGLLRKDPERVVRRGGHGSAGRYRCRRDRVAACSPQGAEARAQLRGGRPDPRRASRARDSHRGRRRRHSLAAGALGDGARLEEPRARRRARCCC